MNTVRLMWSGTNGSQGNASGLVRMSIELPGKSLRRRLRASARLKPFSRARIAAWLVETSGETQVWTGVYDRHLTDVLSVQGDVASRIAGSLAAEIPFRSLESAPVWVHGSRPSSDVVRQDCRPVFRA